MDSVRDEERFALTRLGGEDEDDGVDVAEGLGATRKWLPCRYFYDATGSELFERICATPEYYPTRTERAILEGRASEIASLTGPCELVELGSGSARKTRVLLQAYAADADKVHFVPIDVSDGVLEESSRRLLARIEELTIRGFAGTYEQALASLHPTPAPARMFLFLGSTIGNFSDRRRRAFLCRVRDAMTDGDYFLIGFDRIKDKAVLEAAYNDAAGLTARFNRNILHHLNARFHGNFVPDRFAHLAFYDEARERIEMHLASERPQRVRLADLDLDVNMERDETIHTEISRKFDPDALASELDGLGFARTALWSDEREWFSVLLVRRNGTGMA